MNLFCTDLVTEISVVNQIYLIVKIHSAYPIKLHSLTKPDFGDMMFK